MNEMIIKHAAPSRSVISIDAAMAGKWDSFLKGHESATIYHTVGWKECLERSFHHIRGHLLACLDRASGEIVAGLPVYTINSWLLGNRVSSIPFAPVSDPLISSAADLELLLPEVLRLYRQIAAKSLQITTLKKTRLLEETSLGVSRFHKHHYLRLEGGADQVYRGFSKTAVQQRIRKAEKAGVVVRFAENESDLKLFYSLLVQSRKRLSLPAIPYAFFDALWRRFGDSNLRIFLAFLRGEPVGGQLTFGFNGRFSSEFACDSEGGRGSGVNQVLYWECIKRACEAGYSIFGFGRTSSLNEGLLTFKRQFGAIEQDIGTCIYPASARSSVFIAERSVASRIVRGISGKGPLWLNRMIGAFCYRHWA